MSEHIDDAFAGMRKYLGEFGNVLSEEQLKKIDEVATDIGDAVAVLEDDEVRGAMLFLFLLTYSNEFVQEQFMKRQVGAFAEFRVAQAKLAPHAIYN